MLEEILLKIRFNSRWWQGLTSQCVEDAYRDVQQV